MTVNNYISSVRNQSLASANAQIADVCGISDFFTETAGHEGNLYDDAPARETGMKEYGDWQTSMSLALSVCRLIKKYGANPKVVVEPTCGKGNFIMAALQTFDGIEEIYGIEIHKPYLDQLKIKILQYYLDNPDAKKVKINLYHHDIFSFDLSRLKKSFRRREILVVGNPPWVTNSKLGALKSKNIPTKSNFKKIKGLSAITGKGNFDIAEYICRQMASLIQGEDATLGLLVKNTVIKNIVYEQARTSLPVSSITQYAIDAKKEFGVSVAASLLYIKPGGTTARTCQVKDFYTQKEVKKYGWADGCFASNTAEYEKYRYIDGHTPLKWWSGLKHDCSKVMELTAEKGVLVNGFGQIVDIEDRMIFPLLKSSDISDIKKDRITDTRKYVIVTQRTASEDTGWIRQLCPLAYKYLEGHAEFLDKRGSTIYKKRPRFCLFGIGGYSFKKYKVVVSGFYKEPHFSLVGEIDGKPTMLDDTCYMLGFDDYEEALVAQRILNSPPVQGFIRSLLFNDAKRVINKELLMRIDLRKAVDSMRKEDIGVDEISWENFCASLEHKKMQYSLF